VLARRDAVAVNRGLSGDEDLAGLKSDACRERVEVGRRAPATVSRRAERR
jgi:hypothetical protein